jgi:type IV secretion system protein VirB10
MPVTEFGDPRLQALFGASDPRDAGVRPTVRLRRKGLPPIVLAGVAIVFGVLLFMVLNERRTSQSEPSVRLRPDSAASAWQQPPTLYVPPEPVPVTQPSVEEQHPIPQPVAVPSAAPAPKPMAMQPVYMPEPVQQIAPSAPAPQPRVSAGAPLVIDTGTSAGAPGAPGARVAPSLLGAQPQPLARMRASALANRSMTITQGTVIQAVLETAFNSTQPGFARAVVSRDVRSFDGTNVLIPRGSKLVGEYSADVAAGQKRAVIIWTRLIRPDGMTINMDSPAVDTLGRGGVPASVHTHFFARLGDALLQSTVGLGSLLAQRRIGGPVVVLSGTGTAANAATAAAGQIAPTNSYTPTLAVPAGKSISVFVAHDLDFSAAGAPR